MAIKLKTQIRNGNMFYLIGSEDISKAHIVVVNTISERNSLDIDGFVFVRCPSEGSPNDATVHRGWAMYFSYKDGNDTVWVKVAEEESVDGIWGIEEEVLRQFATKKELSSIVANQAAKNKIYDELRTFIGALDGHKHENKDILDLIGMKNRQITLKTAISSTAYKETYLKDTFIYKEPWKMFSNGRKIPWYDPTVIRSSIANPEYFRSTKEIADKFSKTRAATLGMTLKIYEYDGSISEYAIVSSNGSSNPDSDFTNDTSSGQSNMRAEFVGMNGSSSARTCGLVFVEGLPSANQQYEDGRVFCIVGSGLSSSDNDKRIRGKIGHCYAVRKTKYQDPSYNGSDNWEWFEVTPRYIESDGCIITSCHLTNRTTIRLTYTDPNPVITVNRYSLKRTLDYDLNSSWRERNDFLIELSSPYYTSWEKSVIVRKLGSAPKSPTDGTVVYESYTNNEFANNPFIDVIPETTEKVYYAVFAYASNGSILTPEANASKFWPNYHNWFSVGDYCTYNGHVYKCLNATDEDDNYDFIATDWKRVGFNYAQAKLPDWGYIKCLLDNGNFTKAFSDGDLLASIPWKNSTYGLGVSIVDQYTVRLVFDKSIGKYVFDGTEDGMKQTQDTSWVSGKTYYKKKTSGDQVWYEEITNSSSYSGSPKESYLYEAYSEYSLYAPSYDPSSKKTSGNGNWEESELKKWLNSSSTSNWLEDYDYDESYEHPRINETKGFLAYFNHSDTDEVNKFKSIIQSVELPSNGTNTLRYIPGNEAWIITTHYYDSPYAHTYDPCVDPSMSEYRSDSEKDVYPVLVIGSTASGETIKQLTEYQES